MIFGVMYVQVPLNLIFSYDFLPWGAGTREVWEECLPLKTQKKLSTLPFSISVATNSPVLSVGCIFFSLLVLISGLVFFMFLAKFSSSCALAFFISPLRSWSASLYYSQCMCSCFHCLCISIFSLIRRSFLSHAGLLPSLPDFQHMETESSCAPRKSAFRSCHFFLLFLSLRKFSQVVPSINSLNNWKLALLKFRVLCLLDKPISLKFVNSTRRNHCSPGCHRSWPLQLVHLCW